MPQLGRVEPLLSLRSSSDHFAFPDAATGGWGFLRSTGRPMLGLDRMFSLAYRMGVVASPGIDVAVVVAERVRG